MSPIKFPRSTYSRFPSPKQVSASHQTRVFAEAWWFDKVPVLRTPCSVLSVLHDAEQDSSKPREKRKKRTETWSDSWDKHRWTRWTCRLGSQSGIGHLGDKNCRLERQVRGRGSTILQDPESKCDLETVLAHFLSWPGQHGSYPKIITVCKTMSNLIYTYI